MGLNTNALGQSQVNVLQAPAVEGDFCDANPRWTVDAGQFGIVAGASGLTAGRFAWLTYPGDNDGTPIIANNFGYGLPAGIVHREQQGLITTYLASSGMLQPLGFEATLYNGGGFWLKTTNSALYQWKAYAKYADGTVRFGVTGAPTAGTGGTGSSIAANATATATGTIANGLLTLSSALVGLFVAGATITGTGIPGVANAGVAIVSQVTPLLAGEATGGLGRYIISDNTFSVTTAETITAAYGVLTVAGGSPAGFAVNTLVNGTGVVANTFITQLGTGIGGAGTYYVNNNTVVSSTTITPYSDIETKWFAASQGQTGDLVKTSSHAYG